MVISNNWWKKINNRYFDYKATKFKRNNRFDPRTVSSKQLLSNWYLGRYLKFYLSFSFLSLTKIWTKLFERLTSIQSGKKIVQISIKWTDNNWPVCFDSARVCKLSTCSLSSCSYILDWIHSSIYKSIAKLVSLELLHFDMTVWLFQQICAGGSKIKKICYKNEQKSQSICFFLSKY